jgi:hypothetical protein
VYSRKEVEELIEGLAVNVIKSIPVQLDPLRQIKVLIYNNFVKYLKREELKLDHYVNLERKAQNVDIFD